MIIEVKVVTNAKKEEIIKIENNKYKVSLKEKAENNKPNIELLKLLKKYFGKNVKIIRGLKSRNKIIEIND